MSSGSSIPSSRPVCEQLIYLHAMAAFSTLLLAALIGVLLSLQFVIPDLFDSWTAINWGRFRYAHTQGIMFGWLGNAFFAFLYHAVPALTMKAVTSERLGYWLFALWNFVVVLPGLILVIAGISQPIEWAEFPLIIDMFTLLCLFLAACQFLPNFFSKGLENLYVSSWYIIGSLVFTIMAFPMGNIVPEIVPGAESAAFGGLWIHDAVGLFVTPLALAILYFVIPAVTGRPIFSHFLSMVGFWGLFFLYPLNGTHHYVFSVIPMSAQLEAIAASALLGLVVILVVANLLLSIRADAVARKDIALRYVFMSVIFYLIVSIQGSLQAQMSLNQAVHFTDWVIGHSHLAMLGFATFAGIGGILYAWQKIPWAPYNEKTLGWSFWLLVLGITVMVVDLTIAGLMQARLWQSEAPWMSSIVASRPYWFIRTFSALPIIAGFMLLIYGLFVRPKTDAATESNVSSFEIRESISAYLLTPSRDVLRKSYLIAGIAGLGFFTLSIVLLGVLPGQQLDRQIQLMTPDNVLQPSSAALRGREIYAREGCAYCHTQQIRFLAADITRFGAPTLAWEGQFDFPHLWGTRRIGPDLSRAGSTRNSDWQLAHLYSPRSVVPSSIMPSYQWLFDGDPTRPKQEAYDLLAYLESLGNARDIAWPDGDQKIRDLIDQDRWTLMSVNLLQLNAHPGMADLSRDAPVLPDSAEIELDQAYYLWQNNCAGCHGAQGAGDGPASAWLEPRPADLTQRVYTQGRIAEVLWQGIPGTAMPAWRDQSLEDISALVELVKSFSSLADINESADAELSLGEAVYASNCIQCHGLSGQGDGFAANELQIRPVNFTVQSLSLEESVSILQNGVEGTPMAPWTDRLSTEEIVAVSRYIRSLFIGDDA